MTKYDNYDVFRRYDDKAYNAEIAFNSKLDDFINDNICVIKLRVTLLDSAFFPFGTEDDEGCDIGGELIPVAVDFLNALENEVAADYSRIDIEYRDYLEGEDVLATYSESMDVDKVYIVGMMTIEGICNIEDILDKFSKNKIFRFCLNINA